MKCKACEKRLSASEYVAKALNPARISGEPPARRQRLENVLLRLIVKDLALRIDELETKSHAKAKKKA